jgi:hypothetical protein
MTIVKDDTSPPQSEDVVPNDAASTEVTQPAKKPIRKIRRRKDKEGAPPEARELRMYFSKDTHAAICEYQLMTVEDRKGREMLYISRIMPAFQKLAENLINIHKFSSLYDTYDDLRNDCVNFLFETIRKFDSTRGSNAFSYFNVVAKNWLIIKTKQKMTKIKKNISMDDTALLSDRDIDMIEEWSLLPSQEVMFENKNTAENVMKLLHEIKGQSNLPNEVACINAIIAVFEEIDSVDLLNKSAVLLYMRELSGLSPKQLTIAMQVLKRSYKELRKNSFL